MSAVHYPEMTAAVEWVKWVIVRSYYNWSISFSSLAYDIVAYRLVVWTKYNAKSQETTLIYCEVAIATEYGAYI